MACRMACRSLGFACYAYGGARRHNAAFALGLCSALPPTARPPRAAPSPTPLAMQRVSLSPSPTSPAARGAPPIYDMHRQLAALGAPLRRQNAMEWDDTAAPGAPPTDDDDDDYAEMQNSSEDMIDDLRFVFHQLSMTTAAPGAPRQFSRIIGNNPTFRVMTIMRMHDLRHHVHTILRRAGASDDELRSLGIQMQRASDAVDLFIGYLIEEHDDMVVNVRRLRSRISRTQRLVREMRAPVPGTPPQDRTPFTSAAPGAPPAGAAGTGEAPDTAGPSAAHGAPGTISRRYDQVLRQIVNTFDRALRDMTRANVDGLQDVRAKLVKLHADIVRVFANVIRSMLLGWNELSRMLRYYREFNHILGRLPVADARRPRAHATGETPDFILQPTAAHGAPEPHHQSALHGAPPATKIRLRLGQAWRAAAASRLHMVRRAFDIEEIYMDEMEITDTEQ